MFTDERRFSLVSSHNGTKLCSGFYTWEEFLEKDAEMREDSKGTMFYMYDPDVDSPQTVYSNQFEGLRYQMRQSVIFGTDTSTRYVFIPRSVAKGNMKEIYEMFTEPEHHSSYAGAYYNRNPELIKVGKEGWILLQKGGWDI
jgi:hypothetical protein